jgi:hypothetical protein
MHAYLCAHVCVQVEERTAELLEKNHQLQASHFPVLFSTGESHIV